MTEQLQICSCGKIPNSLIIAEGVSYNWALVMGDCCNEWLVEFRTEGHDLDSAKCMLLAVDEWNRVLRKETNSSTTPCYFLPCPWCGSKPYEFMDGMLWCGNDDCQSRKRTKMTADAWNNRHVSELSKDDLRLLMIAVQYIENSKR